VSTKAATPAEAEKHAKKAVADYLKACGMTEADQIGQFVLKTMPKKPAKLVRVQ